MKKIFAGLLLVAVLLAACSGGSAENEAANDTTVNDQTISAESADSAAGGDNAPSGEAPDFSKMELPLMSQLMIGTFMLEDTEHAVDAAQAAELLPLWQILNNLLNSDTAADQEVDAVVAQIEKTMTAGQLQAIADMALNNESSMAMIQELGLDMQRPDNADDGGSGSFQPGGGPGGDMGGPPDGGGFGGQAGGGTGLSQEEMEALQATRQAGGGGPMGGGNRMNTMLIDPLIELLEGKIS